MEKSSSKLTCAITCWGIAALFGVVVAAVLISMSGWMFLQGAFMGAVGFVVLGVLLSLTLCRDLPHLSEVRAVSSAPAPTAAPDAPSAARTSATAAAAAAMDTATADATDDVAAPAPAPKKAAPAPTPAPKPAPAKPAAAEGEGTKPAALAAARAGGADDLKRIKGVGPKLEQTCNSLGFYHFDQIAAWTADEVAWVDQNLVGFKGRVSRDDWVAQAKLLASGGETEFSKKVDKGDVY
ncbi:hypothetical protein PM03_02180 [Thalassobacter stenotrophicus]|uniref:NADH dehydrogenase subunit E n=2 Tax=Thalassobacter stenotrophicus TaxID=266809 RepID=A0A0P1F341_9RHOB|nr:MULTISPECIES: hypothetical protein [Thalassobacter]KGK80760.1 hypothetical protein PM03_02180 [Thalassobacter stenotrophicus]KGL02143.1 ATP synthase subunit E [Thalassobacter sp. 16PALIMAR09]PVZ48982.1 hypothetical protein DD557_09680 [Thalassobacter stenotrophicus]CUH62041.1 NADH dehydrogenase subunit E [Thalassobacter stenotrophicus]SHI36281.1 Predicted 5' DNA nuclease, flap endonuclease-1-like, helix-3-turn-helix (H3TH) domain [Thalassobacter stenotrophicus DSM 16310]